MPHNLNPSWGHVYDWLDEPPADEAERQAKEWLEAFVKPAGEKDHAWLDARILLCTYEGEVYRVTGASRLGDVWLRRDQSRDRGYDRRVDILKCSDWRLKECTDERSAD